MMLPILAKRTHINRSSSSASTMYAVRCSPVLRHSGGTLIGHLCHKPTPLSGQAPPSGQIVLELRSRTIER
jgi:hypothetical protein